MALRLIEIIVPQSESQDLRELLEGTHIIETWQGESSAEGLMMKVLVSAEDTEHFLDSLENRFGKLVGFRVVMLAVEAILPRYKEKEALAALEKAHSPSETIKKKALRVSREELFSEIADNLKFTKVFVAMVVLSSIVAAIGLLHDNPTVVIGAMVIAPLLGPNVGLAFATTLGDFKLGRDALKINLFGLTIALILSIAIGYFWEVDAEIHEIVSRTDVHLSDITLALAAGIAGVLAFSSGTSAALIGVMVAVALLPPTVTFGLLIGSGYFYLSRGALLLLLTNLICINLAGVTTFLIQGIRPREWWATGKAKKTTLIAITLWSVLLLVLIIIILLSQKQ